MQTNSAKIMANVIIYIVVFAIVISIVGAIMSYFYNNVRIMTDRVSTNSDYAILNLYFLKTINNKNISIKSYGLVDNNDTSSYYITFLKDDGTTSTFIKQGSIIYFNKIKLCENVEQFKVIVDKSEKESFSVEVIILGKTYNSQYALNK